MDPVLAKILRVDDEKEEEKLKIPALTGTPADRAQAAVLVQSVELPADTPYCRGYDFNQGINYDDLFEQFKFGGFQATNLGLAIDEINKMLHWRLSDEKLPPEELEILRETKVNPAEEKCKIFLGFTSNMISCGVREIIRYLCQHRLVDYIVTTGGGIEEDFMKCWNKHYMGDFAIRGRDLRVRGLNRIGNLIVPNKNYCSFEEWFMPILNTCLKEQKEQGTVWSPSKLIHRMGREINNPDSVYYWCYKNNIPVFCPAIIDGAVGDVIFFHSYKNPGFVLDIAQDIKLINDAALSARHSGMLILGGGVVKHHICNANLMRNGADYAVFINTGQEFDGSDSGARPDEAVSWGKIKLDARPVKVYGDASVLFPLIAAQTFAKYVEKKQIEQIIS